MRVAIISDVHGNYPALVSVMNDAIANDVDKFVFVGDYIFDFPFSNEVAQLLMNLENAHIVKGNKEGYLSDLANDNQDNWTSAQFGGLYQTFRELSSEAYNFLNNLDEECYVQLSDNVSLFAVHFFKNFKMPSDTKCLSSNFNKQMRQKPFSHEQFLSEFNDFVNSDEFKAQIENIDADVIVFGHNHLQGFGCCGNKLIVNPGSCGLPLDFKTTAPYTIIEETNDGILLMERRVSYDIEDVISQAKKSMIYEKSEIWSELVFLALRTGRDYFGLFFETARQIAMSKNENSKPFSNATWEEAYKIFITKKFTRRTLN